MKKNTIVLIILIVLLIGAVALNAWIGHVIISNPYKHLGEDEDAYITCYNAGCDYSIYQDDYTLYGVSWNHPDVLYCEAWYFGYHGDELIDWSESPHFSFRLMEVPENSNPNPTQ